MTFDEYDGPRYRFGFRIGLLLSFVPLLGLASAGGGVLFLIDQRRLRGGHEVTSVPAETRGDIVVALLAHMVYVLSIVPFVVIP